MGRLRGGERNHHVGLSAHPDPCQAHSDLIVPMRTHGFTHGAQSPASQARANQAAQLKQQTEANRALHGGAPCGQASCSSNTITVPQFTPPQNLGGHPLVGSNDQSLMANGHLASANTAAVGDAAVYASGNAADPNGQAGGKKTKRTRKRRKPRKTAKAKRKRLSRRARRGRSRLCKSRRSRKRATAKRSRRRRR